MRRNLRLVLVAALLAVLADDAAIAQQRARPPKPYQPLAIELPQAIDDATLDAFRNQIAAVAKGRVYAELERLVAVQGFFWERDFGGGFDAKRPGVDNLAAAIGLERRNGAGWTTLARLAAETTVTPFTGRPGVICAPGEVRYDSVDFDRLLDATRSDGFDWVAPRADKTPVRAAARSNAGVIDTLGLALVRVLGYQTKDRNPDPARTWVRVMTPAGKVGFVAPGALTSLLEERLCYGKDGFNRWHIAGYVGGGD